MKYTHVIWDFNGTILDDVGIGIESTNQLLRARNLPEIRDVEHYRSIFGFPIKEYYRRCGFNFSVDDYESVLAPQWVEEYNKREHKSSLCIGVHDALRLLQRAGIRQSILSASDSRMLYSQVRRLGIADYFEHIIGCDNFFAYGKTELCVDFVRLHPEQHFILLGDTTHDHEVACAAGIDCALVLTGHMNTQMLKATNAPLFENAMEFSKYITNL